MQPDSIQTRLLAAFVALALVACDRMDGNIFAGQGSRQEKGQEETRGKATEAIKEENWQDAERHLETIIEEEPQDNQSRSMLGNVLLAKTGVNSLDIAKDIAAASDSKGTVHVPSLLQDLPEPTPENLANLKRSMETFATISPTEITPSQMLQKATAEFIYAAVLLKKVSSDAEGHYDRQKAATMTGAEANEIVATFDQAATSMAAAGGDRNTKGAGKIKATTSHIRSYEGVDMADNLRSYLEQEARQER